MATSDLAVTNQLCDTVIAERRQQQHGGQDFEPLTLVATYAALDPPSPWINSLWDALAEGRNRQP